MLALLGNHPPCLLFEQLFLERLPEDIRIQLVDTKIENHRDLSRRADALWSSRNMTSFDANTIQRTRKQPAGSRSQPKTTASQFCYYHRTFGEAARQCRHPCTWSETDKVCRSLVAAVTCHNRGLLFIYDSITKQPFLVDTGAEVSVLPATSLEKRTMSPGPHSLRAANGTSIWTYGYRNVTLHIASNIYNWSFLIANVSRALLGADFLCSHALLVDVRGRRLVDATSFVSTPLSFVPNPPTLSAFHPMTTATYSPGSPRFQLRISFVSFPNMALNIF